MTTQELITKAELSDAIFDALTGNYAYAIKMKYDKKEQRGVLERAVPWKQEQGLIPHEVSPAKAVEIFFNRL